ncbi:MAG: glycosyltransferase family 4 protein [Anaerolineales bacterium]
MKIALFHNLPSGGAKRHTLEQIRELDRRGHQITEFAPSTADLDYCSFAPFVQEQRVFEFSPPQLLQRRVPFITPYVHALQGREVLNQTDRLNRKIAHEIDAGEFDLVFVKDCHIAMNPYILRHLKTRSVFQCHHGLRHRLDIPGENGTGAASNLINRIKLAYYQPARRLFLNQQYSDEKENIHGASRVITNSKFSKQLIRQVYEVNSHIVYPGINTHLFRPISAEEQDYVLGVGALIYGKGYRFLVSAISQIEASLRPRMFIAANTIDPAEEYVIRQLAEEKGVELHIESIKDDQRLVRVYNQAKVFVYSPLQEALGMAPLEAMACGTPVVAVAEGGIRETVVEGETGWLVERDEAAFSETLASLLKDRDLRRAMGSAGVAYVRQNWSWGRAIDRLEFQFDALFDGSHR